MLGMKLVSYQYCILIALCKCTLQFACEISRFYAMQDL